METPAETPQPSELRDYLAAERTLLAWLRTGLALMGFGFVVARFGLFVQQLFILRSMEVRPPGLSLWFGTVLIAAGVAVNLASAWQHVRLIRSIDRGRPFRPHATNLAVGTAVFLALVGLGMAVYLLTLRESARGQPGNDEESRMETSVANGIVTKRSRSSVDDTVEKLTAALQAKGVTIFAIIDHSGEAAKVGMNMRPTKLLIFGSPKAGTPLMLAAPTIAIDLPLKILVWDDGQGRALVSYNSPQYLQARHGLPQELVQNIAVVDALAASVSE